MTQLIADSLSRLLGAKALLRYPFCPAPRRVLFCLETPMSDTSLIPEKEVMNKLGVSSRQTIWNYTNRHGFPKPVRTHPKAYLREAVDGWILNGGVNQKCS